MLTKGPDTQSPTYSCRDPEGLPAEARGQDITEGLSETPETPETSAQEVAEDEDGYWAAQSAAVEAAAFLGLDPAADNSPDAGYYYPPTKVKPCRDPKELMIRVAEAVGEQLRQLDERWPRQIAPATAKRWGRAKPPKLPELMKPDGAGYMPLYCAAQWIVTRGGTLNPHASAAGYHTTAAERRRNGEGFRQRIWREAYKELLDRIASEDVKVVGERPDGVSEEISGAHFASCAVDYPFSDRRLLNFNDRVLGNGFCLVSRPYLDDEHWRRGGYDDRLENRQGVRWRRLQVLKADIARWWPFVSINANATLTQADATLSASASLQPQPALAVTNGPPTHTPAARPAQPERTPRKRLLRERAQRALSERYPSGVPDRASVSDAELVSAVNAQIKKCGQQGVSRHTILRAAERLK